MTELKLCYFNGRGLAETSRLLLAAVNQPYTDFRYPLEVLDWKTYSFKREEFDKAKSDGSLSRSLNKVPYLEVGTEVVCQSKTIERYLARRFNLMGNNELEAAKIDSICEWVRDFKTDYQTVRKTDESKRDEAMNNWFSETLPSKLNSLEHLVSSTFSVGGRLSLADVSLFSFLTQFFDNTEGATNSMNNTPNIKSVVDTVSNLDSVKHWLATRPVTSF
jgi:glutathione S-transferase